jgi:hypothetical protein
VPGIFPLDDRHRRCLQGLGYPGLGVGILALRVRIDGLTAENNSGGGVLAKTTNLRNSTLTGNDGFAQGYDGLSGRRPRLVATTCGRSGRVEAPLTLVGSWGVCAGD